MSFFGFAQNIPQGRPHPSKAPGFGQAPDPFAGVSKPGVADDDDDALDFEDTYDGLGDELDENDDTFNDDTFGGGGSGTTAQQAVGKDFDFYGSTAKVSGAINEEQHRYSRQQPPPRSMGATAASPSRIDTRPARSGYEKYKEQGNIPDLQVNASLWGVQPKGRVPAAPSEQQRSQSYGSIVTASNATGGTGKKMMNLEEVEAAIRAESKKSQPVPPVHQPSQPSPYSRQPPQQPGGVVLAPDPQTVSGPQLSQISQQRVSQTFPHAPVHHQLQQNEPRVSSVQPPQILQRQHPIPSQSRLHNASPQPRQILQNPSRHEAQAGLQQVIPRHVAQNPQLRSFNGLPQQTAVVTHPQQLLQLSDDERAAFLIEDAKRAKRNHKIHLLSKDNGLMTPQDKNFITRIQLQQLVTATGGTSDHGADAALAEDFYYQVHSQIRGGPRPNPHQPLSHFAQTYLFQTGGRHAGAVGRRQTRGGENHMQRMEQQVQRAVEAAKLKPKNKQLVIEGSLGKISFSNAKTPKPLLNLKRAESGDITKRPHSARSTSDRKVPQVTVSASDRKTILRNIENVYGTLMEMEDQEQHKPPAPNDESDAQLNELHVEWVQKMKGLNQKLFNDLKVLEPIDPDSTAPHPFISFLSLPKGKKAIPRIFRHIDQEQRIMIITVIVVHLDLLDVIRNAQMNLGEQQQLPLAIREEVELFSQAVFPSLFGYINEAPLHIVSGLLGLILGRANVPVVARTKVGVGILTILVSRAELSRQADRIDEREWEQWTTLYNRLFDTLEPILAYIFPGTINSGEDMYIWQFLAAIGIGASPEQQQRLVIAVKDRVMETVMQSKALPPERGAERLSNVNLFMRAIGLDVEQLG
ncbi:MAG: hypothetical protein M1835_001850 [Candelina submexicana]|nr:MAG: hypothetical protein M1835_001850 [Candelina submexicana]